MAHYFTASPSSPDERSTIDVTLAGRDLTLHTSGQVFSSRRLDLGTRVLLREVPAPPAQGQLLDLGCGWGPIALTMGLLSPQATVWAVDVNERALALTQANAVVAGTSNVRPVSADQVPDDVRFAAIWSNPPIRVGKPVLHNLLTTWLPRLTDDGHAYLVVQRNLGADSLIDWLNRELSPALTTRKRASAKGFRVIEVAREA